MIDYQRTCNV